jgi:hypothetical protein
MRVMEGCTGSDRLKRSTAEVAPSVLEVEVDEAIATSVGDLGAASRAMPIANDIER